MKHHALLVIKACSSSFTVGKPWGCATLCSFYLASLGSSFGERVANLLTFRFYEQEEKGWLGEKLLYACSEQSDGSIIKDPLNRCNTRINFLKISLFVAFSIGLARFFKLGFIEWLCSK